MIPDRSVTDHRLRRLLPAAFGAAAMLALAACGGADDDTGAGGGDPSETAEQAPDGTTPESALEPGETVELWGWEVTVTAVELDATATIMDETGILAKEPAAGHEFAKVAYEGTYVGDDPDNSFYTDLVVSFEVDGVVYDDCGANFTADMYFDGPVQVGDVVTSAFCAEIPIERDGAVVVNFKDWQPTGQTGFYFTTE